jgi:hypothetical protein
MASNTDVTGFTDARRRCLAWPERAASISVPITIMDDKHKTISLKDLMDEMDRDLATLRAKNPQDYSLRPISLWLSLERERLELRHTPHAVVAITHRLRGVKRTAAWVIGGQLVLLAGQAMLG